MARSEGLGQEGLPTRFLVVQSARNISYLIAGKARKASKKREMREIIHGKILPWFTPENSGKPRSFQIFKENIIIIFKENLSPSF